VAVPAFLLGALWWGRNIIVYGGLDVLGKAAHDLVVTGQPRTAEWLTQYGLTGTIQRFLQTTFNSFWGQFGWMTIPMPTWLYQFLWLFVGLVLVGIAIYYFQKVHPMTRPSPLAPRLLALTFLLTAALHIGYNFTFVQHQGRYLFPALLPIGVGVAVGLGAWTRPLQQRWPFTQYLLPLGLWLALIGLNLFVIFRVLLPTFQQWATP
jgi:hypothetical protein